MLGKFLELSAEVNGQVFAYQVYVPSEISAPLPAILFLHGYGESGIDGSAQVSTGLGPAIRENPERWPFLVVFPQKPEFEPLWPEYLPMLNKILVDVEDKFSIDKNRLYITGLSQGGNGTLALARSLRWQFAAAAPICGWENPRTASLTFKEMPLWLFHGELDSSVPFESSVSIVKWMRRWKLEPKLTIYPGVGHDSWIQAYRDNLPEWLLTHTLEAMSVEGKPE